jgi:hypothetical protein
MNTICDSLSSVRFGQAQTYLNVEVLPLFSVDGSRIEYLTMQEAMENELLRVTEFSQHGSVPDLKVINRADTPVLLLDGEELIGAKQNRVLNTTILLKENSETVIPVSCAERGRWSYSSAHFAASDVVMVQRLRARKLHSVSASLEACGSFCSDQGLVWEEISALVAKAKSPSPTDAMHDVFEAKKEDLRRGLEALRTVPSQKGLLVLINGRVAGFDLLSSAPAYARLHPKLVKSYLLEALLAAKCSAAGPDQAQDKAKTFLDEAARCELREFPSVGYGRDCRFSSGKLGGSALIHQDNLIHAAFFGKNEGSESGQAGCFRQRCRDSDATGLA